MKHVKFTFNFNTQIEREPWSSTNKIIAIIYLPTQLKTRTDHNIRKKEDIYEIDFSS